MISIAETIPKTEKGMNLVVNDTLKCRETLQTWWLQVVHDVMNVQFSVTSSPIFSNFYFILLLLY